MFEKIVVVTRKTALEELVEKFNSKAQAKFYIEHTGASFDEYEDAHDTYYRAVEKLQKLLPEQIRSQFVERSFLTNFLFGPKDVVIALGQDGLVINVAKYLDVQPIIGINPDVFRIDGVLTLFDIDTINKTDFAGIFNGEFDVEPVSMAKASLNNGQELYGVNDIYIGPKSQVSFRYHVKFGNVSEKQCSSGLIISTGAGSTGWFRSLVLGAHKVVEGYEGKNKLKNIQSAWPWEADYLHFCVREPFPSKTSQTNLVFGKITPNKKLYITSENPQGAVIFSDGIEADYLEFNSGRTATIELAQKKARLIRAKRTSAVSAKR